MQLLRVINRRTAGSAQHLQELRNFDLSKSGQGFICGKSTIHHSNAEERTNPSMYGTPIVSVALLRTEGKKGGYLYEGMGNICSTSTGTLTLTTAGIVPQHFVSRRHRFCVARAILLSFCSVLGRPAIRSTRVLRPRVCAGGTDAERRTHTAAGAGVGREGA